jgi:hypothetical protein
MFTGCVKQDNIVEIDKAPENNIHENVIEQPVKNDYINISQLSNLFGFTNEDGKQIISTDYSEQTQSITKMNKAIGENGNILDIQYLKSQEKNEKDNGRQTSQNFDNLSGQIFEVIQGEAKENETYYLINDMEFNINAILKSQDGNHSEIAIEAKEQIEEAKGRKVKSGWEIGSIESDKAVYLVQFEREKDDMLASIVMKTPTTLVFKDYPAEYNEMSTWRVDDGGNIYPEMFSVLLAAKTESGILLGIKWSAFEGENVTLLLEKDDNFEDLNIEASRYTSPL